MGSRCLTERAFSIGVGPALPLFHSEKLELVLLERIKVLVKQLAWWSSEQDFVVVDNKVRCRSRIHSRVKWPGFPFFWRNSGLSTWVAYSHSCSYQGFITQNFKTKPISHLAPTNCYLAQDLKRQKIRRSSNTYLRSPRCEPQWRILWVGKMDNWACQVSPTLPQLHLRHPLTHNACKVASACI